MKISWYGQSCFKIKCKDVDILIDPYHESTGLKLSKTKTDLVLVTHGHEDHNNIGIATGDPVIINGPGEYEVRDVFIYGKQAYHDDNNGKDRGVITMYLIEEDGLKLAHLGDIGQKRLTDDQLEFLDDVDILLLPVGGKYTINAQEASEILSEVEPRIVVPMHYKMPGLKMDLDSVDNFVKEIGLNPEKMDELKVTRDSLPSEDLKLVILNKQ